MGPNIFPDWNELGTKKMAPPCDGGLRYPREVLPTSLIPYPSFIPLFFKKMCKVLIFDDEIIKLGTSDENGVKLFYFIFRLRNFLGLLLLGFF